MIDDKLIGQWTEGFKWSGLSGVWKIENHQLKSLVERAAKYGAEQVKLMESPKREFPKVATEDMRRVFRKAFREGGFWSDRLDYALDQMLRSSCADERAYYDKLIAEAIRSGA